MSSRFPFNRCCLIVVALGLLGPAYAYAQTAKVFLIGGQSNAHGTGLNRQLYQPYSVANPDVKIWKRGWANAAPGYGVRTKQFGPEVMLAQMLKRAMPGEDIRIVKHASSGTNLAKRWNPEGTGPLYNTFKGKVDAALANLTANSIDYEIVGMLWMQGESDAMDPTHAANYATNLTNFIGKVRSDYSVADMPFVLGRITTHYGPAADNATVRTAQATVADADANVAWFDTDTLEIASYNAGHYGTEGNIALGGLFAHHVLETAGITPAAAAMQITVRDGSFEAGSANESGNGKSPNWFSSVLYDPSNADFAGTTGGAADNGPGGTNASGTLPDGGQVAFVFDSSTLSQTLDAFVTPGGEYELTFSVGQWLKAGFLGFADYRVQLLAGDTTIIDVTNLSALIATPAAGSFEEITLSGIAGADAKGTLRIVLTSLSGDDALTFFDDVQLTMKATSQVPSPAALPAGLTGRSKPIPKAPIQD